MPPSEPAPPVRAAPPPEPVPAVNPPAPPPPSAEPAPRFRPLPHVESLPLAEREEGVLVMRCCECEAENSVFAKRCILCGQPLDSPAQRAYVDKVRREREIYLAKEQAEIDLLKQRRADADPGTRNTILQAEVILSMERARSPWLNPDQDRTGQPSLGLQLLRRIPDARHRLAVLLGTVGLVLLLVFVPERGSTPQVLGLVLSLVVSLLFLPPGLLRGRRRGWD